jgi:hypothetical protein
LGGVLDDCDDTLELFGSEFTGTVGVDALVFHCFRGAVENAKHLVDVPRGGMYRLLRSTSAFLQTKLLYRRPTPLILVKAYITFCLPSTCIPISRQHISFPSTIVSFVVAWPRAPSAGILHSAFVVRTLVLSRRKMNWKFDFSPVTSDIFAVEDVAAIW